MSVCNHCDLNAMVWTVRMLEAAKHMHVTMFPSNTTPRNRKLRMCLGSKSIQIIEMREVCRKHLIKLSRGIEMTKQLKIGPGICKG
eukprot:3103878-Amphidinium_carterae.1